MIGLMIRILVFVLLFLFLKKVIESVLLFLSISKKIQSARRENLGTRENSSRHHSANAPESEKDVVIEAEYKVLRE